MPLIAAYGSSKPRGRAGSGRPITVTDTNAKLDIQAPSTAITEIAKGMSDVRDALQAPPGRG